MSDAELRAERLRNVRDVCEGALNAVWESAWRESQKAMATRHVRLRDVATKARALVDACDVLAEHQLRDAGVSAAHAELREALDRLREVEG